MQDSPLDLPDLLGPNNGSAPENDQLNWLEKGDEA